MWTEGVKPLGRDVGSRACRSFDFSQLILISRYLAIKWLQGGRARAPPYPHPEEQGQAWLRQDCDAEAFSDPLYRNKQIRVDKLSPSDVSFAQ